MQEPGGTRRRWDGVHGEPCGGGQWVPGHPVFACACQQRGPGHHHLYTVHRTPYTVHRTPLQPGTLATTYRLRPLPLGHPGSRRARRAAALALRPLCDQGIPPQMHTGERRRGGDGVLRGSVGLLLSSLLPSSLLPGVRGAGAHHALGFL